ncbi:hypothetical protein ACQ4PT_046258 [Festuca glaucescens]
MGSTTTSGEHLHRKPSPASCFQKLLSTCHLRRPLPHIEPPLTPSIGNRRAREPCPPMPATSAGAEPPGSGPRRSERARRRRLPPDETPPSPAATAAPGPSSPPSRRRRDASPSRRSVRARGKEELQPPVVVLNDAEVNRQKEAQERNKQGKEIVEAEGPEEVDENAEALKEAPFWFPDGWIIHVRHDDDGSTYRYYTSPVSEYTFSTDTEALNYLFSEMDEHMLESHTCTEDNELHNMNAWLPDSWVIEVRAGGKMMDKMYKFFVHLPTGMRFFSKEDVLRYVNEGVISTCNVKGLCDTTSEDNILAQVEFNPDGLPKGWVKEMIFRKCNDGIRKHPYYTDPVSHLVFRTLKSVMSYLETGEINKHACIPRRSVTDIYSFDRCTDLPRRMLKRLKVQGKRKEQSMKSLIFDKKSPDDQKSNRSQGGTSASMIPVSEPKEKEVNTMEAKCKEPVSSETTKRPRGRPRKIPKQTNETASGCAKSSDKETSHIAVKKEFDTGTGEQLSEEKALRYHQLDNTAMVTLEVNNQNDLVRSPSPRSRCRRGRVTDPDMHEHENGNSSEARAKSTSSTAQKVYMRRNSNQTPAFKKEHRAIEDHF